MLNLLVEKRASKDRDQSGSGITRPRMGTPTGFVQISRLDFGLGTSPYTVETYFILFCFIFPFIFISYFLLFSFIFFYCSSFDIISTCISHSHPCRAFIHCYLITCNFMH